MFVLAAAPVAARPPAADRAAAKRLYLAGKKHYRLRNFRTALHHFRRAYQRVPLSGLLFNIGQCHRFLGDCKKANFFYRSFVRDNPGTPDAAFVRKLIRECEHRLRTIDKRREQANALFIRGKKELTLGQYRAALELFRQAYRIQPLPGYLFHLAEAHRGLKELAKAIEFYENYLRENPGNPRTKEVRDRIRRTRRELLDRIRRGLAKPLPKPKPGPVPLYKRWWLWTTVAAVVATAMGVGIGVWRWRSTRGDNLPNNFDFRHDIR